jgi:hypothetical protein
VVYLPETAADQAKVELLKARVDVPRQSRPA